MYLFSHFKSPTQFLSIKEITSGRFTFIAKVTCHEIRDFCQYRMYQRCFFFVIMSKLQVVRRSPQMAWLLPRGSLALLPTSSRQIKGTRLRADGLYKAFTSVLFLQLKGKDPFLNLSSLKTPSQRHLFPFINMYLCISKRKIYISDLRISWLGQQPW